MPLVSWIMLGVSVAISVLLVTVLHWLLTHQLAKVWRLAEPLVRRCRYSAYAAAVVIGVNFALPAPGEFDSWVWYRNFDHGMTIAMIASLTWLALSVAYALTDGVLERLRVHDDDTDRAARRVRTQVRVLRRVISSTIIVLATAAILFTFDEIRALGAGLLGTAGLLGIIAGVAAQATLGNVFAGLQLAFSDALRIDDVVVVEGEWGRVEELSLTHVVVRIWDERRLVLPVSHFTTSAFENWTKHGATVTGKVVLRVDWRTPVNELREHVGGYIAKHPLWDGRRWSLQAIDVLESGVVELRVVVTAADSDAQWDLCCDIREHMLAYIGEHHPEALPRRRAELEGEDTSPSASLVDERARRQSIIGGTDVED
ncbi:mechanosensitive ion channel [Lipingzhangella sp. LS1_29]|uniref:Mechanosensitive ion channel n=1 Tax=Lipingzhangella rawalii TaxID=2055835 RepID=A0ABU2H2G2_9ACTN|nr:mechanosensitive ion channel domain-containing protein [Lipingzhangella rawalii]MDS1269486.1 mechanosensitive ion channel [Lipingzhangella rawalii]